MLDEKVVRRGEVWWVSADGSSDWEMNFGRPAIVVSGNAGNEKTDFVIVVFVTSQKRPASPVHPKVMFPEGERRAMCNQVYTVAKSRLDRKICTLTESEMIRVSGALAVAMCIPQYNKPNPLVAEQKQENPENPDVAAMKLEIDMWRRMYEKTMDQLVELRVAQVVAQRTNRVVVVEAVAEKEHPEIAVDDLVPEREPVKHGLVEPDTGVEDEESELTPEKPQKKPRKKAEPKESVWDGVKVNINTVESAQELHRRTGMSKSTAEEILRVRKEMGNYEKVEDLLALDRFGNTCMKRYGHMLTVADEEPAEGAPETEKKKQSRVNVNTATRDELIAAGFSAQNAAKIRRWVREYGPFGDLDDLTKIDTIRGKALRKIRENLEV